MNKLYIICPEKHETGGTELVHQFAHEMSLINNNCFIVYYRENSFIKAEVPNSFKKYKVNVADSIEDLEGNTVIIPEITLYFSKKLSNVNLIYWWMSFDNFFNGTSLIDVSKFYLKGLFSLKRLVLFYYNYKNEKSYSLAMIKRNQSKVLNVYQSKYASDQLHKLNIDNQMKLSDYINVEYSNLEYETVRENIVLYNPAKGLPVTKKIMEKLPNVKFVALKGMNRQEMLDNFRKSKLYIDFGNHPGKDRMPREAAINGCCILVGKRGSAKYFEDVPISDFYKISETNINEIVSKIKVILEQYEEFTNDFDFYREMILKEKQIFCQEVSDINDFLIKKWKSQ